MGPAETLMGTRPMMGMAPRGIQRWRAGEHRTSPHGEDVAWRPGYLGQRHPGPHGKGQSGVGAQSARGSAKCLSLAAMADKSSTGNEDFGT